MFFVFLRWRGGGGGGWSKENCESFLVLRLVTIEIVSKQAGGNNFFTDLRLTVRDKAGARGGKGTYRGRRPVDLNCCTCMAVNVFKIAADLFRRKSGRTIGSIIVFRSVFFYQASRLCVLCCARRGKGNGVEMSRQHQEKLMRYKYR